MSDLRASLVIVGNEILSGYVADKNLPTTANTLRRNGVPLDDVAVVRDRIDEIVAALQVALDRPRPRLVFTSGGLGPTRDDVTTDAIAELLRVPMRHAPELTRPIQSIISWMEEQGFHLDEDDRRSMMRIARVPSTASVLRHRKWLMAVINEIDGGSAEPTGATVLSLPGPPGHFRTLLSEVIAPRFIEGRGIRLHVHEIEHDYPETLLTRHLDRIRERCPSVLVGSYPGTSMVVRFEGPREEVETAAEMLHRALEALDDDEAAMRVKRAWQEEQPAAWG